MKDLEVAPTGGELSGTVNVIIDAQRDLWDIGLRNDLQTGVVSLDVGWKVAETLGIASDDALPFVVASRATPGSLVGGIRIRDVFVFKSADNVGGFNIIRQFEDTTDKIDLSEYRYTNSAEVFEDDAQVGAKGDSVIRSTGVAIQF